MVVPRSTYRLQLGSGMQFLDVAALAPYLGRLGISHVYLSPILQAAPGSTHGYDAVDDSRVSDELGGEPALREAARTLAAEGVGIVVDVVPNHVAIPAPEYLNRQVWSLLREGRESPYALWFDVHWSADGRLLLPLLGRPLAASLEAGELTLDLAGGPEGEPVLRYFDHVFPVRSGTEGLALADLVHAQHYALATWRRANDEVNYRRFFDVDTLVGIRVERPEVFEAKHATLLRLHSEGVIDAFRIDHVDGLADPAGYLSHLADEAGSDTWTVVEKILLGDEKLPEGWRCAGTTGYDAMWRIGALFADPGGADLLRKGFAEGTGEHRGWAEVERESRRHVLGALLGAEVARLVELALDICAEDGRAAVAEPTQLGLTDALVEVLVHIPVYRLYVAAGTPASSELLQAWEQVVAASTADSPHRTAEISLIRDIAVGAFGRSELKDEFIRRLQQTCGAAVAKGVEDTAAYRWTPLSSMNEVGASPDSCGLPAAEFHAWAAVRAARWPDTMNALTTHDAKRGEDVRARITALSEAPQRWLDLAARWTHSGLPGDVDSPGALRRDPISASLLWQTLWGAWPISADRLDEYLRKAAREAKLHTSWLAPDQAYESALLELGHRALADPALRADFAALERDLVDAIAANTLGATAVHLLLPGVPDVYQGTEQLFLRLVDPDNRQEPDWAGLHRSLDRALSAPPDPSQGLDAAKLRLTALALRLRRDSPEVFGSPSDYAPLAAAGPTAQHLFGFVRGDVAVTVTRWASRLAEAGGWGATVADLAPGRWVDLLSARAHDVGPAGVALAGLHASWPVTLLVRER